MPRFPKGSQEAKDYMASIRAKRGSGVSGSKEEGGEKKPLIARPSKLKDTEEVRQQLHINRYIIAGEVEKALKEKKITKADRDSLLNVLETPYLSGDKDVNKIADSQSEAFMGLMERTAKKGSGMGSCASGGSAVSGNPSSAPPPPPPPPPPRPSLTPINTTTDPDQRLINDIEEILMSSSLPQARREQLMADLKMLKDRISGNPQSGSGIIPMFKKPKEKVMVTKQPSQADLDYIRVLNELAEFDKGVKEAQERKAKIEKQGGISKSVVAQMMSNITPEVMAEQQRRLSDREALLDPEGKAKRKRAKEQAEEKRRMEDKRLIEAQSSKGAQDVMTTLLKARRGGSMKGSGNKKTKIAPTIPTASVELVSPPMASSRVIPAGEEDDGVPFVPDDLNFQEVTEREYPKVQETIDERYLFYRPKVDKQISMIEGQIDTLQKAIKRVYNEISFNKRYSFGGEDTYGESDFIYKKKQLTIVYMNEIEKLKKHLREVENNAMFLNPENMELLGYSPSEFSYYRDAYFPIQKIIDTLIRPSTKLERAKNILFKPTIARIDDIANELLPSKPDTEPIFDPNDIGRREEERVLEERRREKAEMRTMGGYDKDVGGSGIKKKKQKN